MGLLAQPKSIMEDAFQKAALKLRRALDGGGILANNITMLEVVWVFLNWTYLYFLWLTNLPARYMSAALSKSHHISHIEK